MLGQVEGAGAGAGMRYVVELDYGQDGMPSRHLVNVSRDRETAQEMAEAFALGCVAAFLPNGERGVEMFGSGDEWYVQRPCGRQATVRVRAV